MRKSRRIALGASLVILLSMSGEAVSAQSGTAHGEWRSFAGALGSTRYAPLDQINGDNFADLEVAWVFEPDNLGPTSDNNYQATPLMIDGVLYTTAGSRRNVVALDAGSGEILW